MGVMEVTGVTKDYGLGRGVFDLSFSVDEGEVLGFLGPNGAGKTTTIRQLMGFIRPDKGSLQIRGKDWSGMKSSGRWGTFPAKSRLSIP